MMLGIAARRAALSAPVAAPEPPRALTTLSNNDLLKLEGRTTSSPKMLAMKSPRARAARTSSISACDAPCVAGAVRSLKMRGELTIAACSGCASGTLITSMRNFTEFGSFGSLLV
jgi:hypothetical protein